MPPALSKDRMFFLVLGVPVGAQNQTFMSCYLVLTVGALSHLILQPTRCQDPPKTSSPQCTELPTWRPQLQGSPEMYPRSKVLNLHMLSRNRAAHLCVCSTNKKYLPFYFTQQTLCAAQHLQNMKSPIHWANPFQQVQPGGWSSTRVHWCKLNPAPAELQTRMSPLQELVCILGRMLKNISDPQTFTFWSEVSNVAVVY